NTNVVVALAVERPRREAAKIADTRNRDVDQPVQELVHPLPPQRHLAADRKALADLEARHGDARLRRHGLLPRDAREIAHRVLEHLAVRKRLADAHVYRDL